MAMRQRVLELNCGAAGRHPGVRLTCPAHAEGAAIVVPGRDCRGEPGAQPPAGPDRPGMGAGTSGSI
jgi:hypothetical protein